MVVPMLDEIQGRFQRNLARVRNLILIYDERTPEGRGRREVASGDLLRAAVVLLHASLEDLVRSLAQWQWPHAARESLASLPLAGSSDTRRTKFTMAELALHRGKSVDEVIAQSVADHLERSNYNDPGEIARVLASLGRDTTTVERSARWIGPMMKRRHWIVHRADRNIATGRGHHETQSIGHDTVKTWLEHVDQLGQAILDEFR